MESYVEGGGGDSATTSDTGSVERRKVKYAESSANRALAKQDFRVGVEKAFNKTYSDSYSDVQLYRKDTSSGRRRRRASRGSS